MNFREFKDKYENEEVKKFPHINRDKPLVSILVQTYNHESFISQCLDSILAQNTNFEFEILLGEDNSTDQTREICKEYARKHSGKIRLFLHNPANKIRVMKLITGNFNAVYNLFQAKGKYLAFCEGDDYWTDKHKLQKQVDFLKTNPHFVLSYHKFEEKYEFYPAKENPIALEQPLKDLTKQELAELMYHPLLSTVCFRNCLGDLPEEMIQVINVDSFVLSLLGEFGKAKYQSEIKPSVYRRHSKGVWSVREKSQKFGIKINTYQKLAQYYKKNNDLDLMLTFERKKEIQFKTLIKFNLKNGRLLKTLKYLHNYLIRSRI